MSTLALRDRDVDLEARRIALRDGGKPLRISETEASLLAYLMANGDRYVATAELLTEVWGYSAKAVTGTVKTTINRLRKKVEKDPKEPVHLLALRSVGYRLEVAQAVALPDEIETFVGREQEIAAAETIVRAGARMVTLLGPGGAGKSRLALRLAHRLRDRGWRVYWCELIDAHTPTDILARVARATGVAVAAEEDLLEAVLNRLRDDKLLLIADTLEHLLAFATETVGMAIAEAPGFSVITTSREPLGLPVEERVEVGPLTAEDAIALLEARGVHAEASWRDAVARVDRLPLAVEMLAGQASEGGPAEALAAVLSAGDINAGNVVAVRLPNGTRVEMARRVAVASDASEQSLSPLQVRLVEHLALATPKPVETDTLVADLWPDRLVSANAMQSAISKLRRKLGGSDAIGAVRGVGYALPEGSVVVRDGAGANVLLTTFERSWRLLGEEERSAFVRMSVFVGGCLAEAAPVLLLQGEGAALLAGLRRRGLLRAVADPAGRGTRYRHFEVFRALASERLARDPHHRRVARSFVQHMVDSTERLVSQMDRAGGTHALASATAELDNLFAALPAAFQLGEHQLAVRALDLARKVLTRQGPMHPLAEFIDLQFGKWPPGHTIHTALVFARSLIRTDTGRLGPARRDLEAVIEAQGRTSEAVRLLGVVHRRMGRQAESTAALREAEDLAAAKGDHDEVWRVLFEVAQQHWRIGEFPQAADCLRRARHSAELAGNLFGLASISVGEAQLLHGSGAYAAAMEAHDRAAAALTSVGHPRMQVRVLTFRARALLEQGRAAEARRAYAEALTVAERAGAAALMKAHISAFALWASADPPTQEIALGMQDAAIQSSAGQVAYNNADVTAIAAGTWARLDHVDKAERWLGEALQALGRDPSPVDGPVVRAAVGHVALARARASKGSSRAGLLAKGRKALLDVRQTTMFPVPYALSVLEADLEDTELLL
jgi:DNA-binding response OmpR family regulator/predicted ATPase